MVHLSTGPYESEIPEETCEASLDTALMVRMRMTEETVYQLIGYIDERERQGLARIIERHDLSDFMVNGILANIQKSPTNNKEALDRTTEACVVLAQIAEVLAGREFPEDAIENVGNLSNILYFLKRGKDLVCERDVLMNSGDINVHLFEAALEKLRMRILRAVN